MYIIDLLANDNYTTVNKTLAKKIGIENALLLGTLCSLQKTFKGKQFYRPESQLIEDTCLTLYSLRKCKNELVKLGILEIEKKGLPAQHFFKINEDAIKKLLDDRITSSSENIIYSSVGSESTSSAEIDTTSDNEINTTTYNIEDNINNNIKNNNINTTTNINYSNNKELSSNSSNKDIFTFIEENIGRTLSPLEYQEICTWEDNDLTRYAIKEAVLNGKCTIGYIRGILHNYKQNNITSVQQAEMKKEEFQRKKARPYETKQEREEREFQEMLDRVIGSDDDD
jgi:DnaD/phage-associated family protein